MISLRFAVVIVSVILFGTTVFSASKSMVMEGSDGGGTRWGRVDFTQYCGRTVGELIDTLGNDFIDINFDEEPLGYLSSCTFVYNDGEIRIAPSIFIYCHQNSKEGQWTLDEFRKETIDYIQIELPSWRDSVAPEKGKEINAYDRSIHDYGLFVGATIGSFLIEFGYGCTYGWADTGNGECFGYWFVYPNHVNIWAAFDTVISIPEGITATDMLDEYILKQRIGKLAIYFCGREGEGYSDDLVHNWRKN